jgi:hypothetical protein
VIKESLEKVTEQMRELASLRLAYGSAGSLCLERKDLALRNREETLEGVRHGDCA